MHSYYVAGYHMRGLLDGLRGLQLDVDQLLRDCNIDRSMLEDPEMRFSDMQVGMLWIFAEQRYGKPTFGLDLAMRVGFGKLELIDYLVAACPTIGSGIECLVHHSRLCSSGLAYRIEPYNHDGEAGQRLIADHFLPVAALPHSMAEYAWGSMVTRFRQFCSKDFRPVLWLRQRPRMPATELIELLGRVPEIGDEEALFVPNTQWNIENPRRDPMLHKLLVAHARDVTGRLPVSDFLGTLQGAVVSSMHQGDPSIGRVATRLAMSTRTLQRRLEADGISYQAVVEELRHEMALRYLEQTHMSLTEISALLAYADASAFGRAFRRWTGRSPAAFRQELRLQGGAPANAPPRTETGAAFSHQLGTVAKVMAKPV